MLNLEGAKIHDFEIFCDSCGENITDNPLRMDMRIFQGNTHGGGKYYLCPLCGSKVIDLATAAKKRAITKAAKKPESNWDWGY